MQKPKDASNKTLKNIKSELMNEGWSAEFAHKMACIVTGRKNPNIGRNGKTKA